MLLDLEDAGDELQHACDVCIIGSGATGITAAREFIGTPHSVVVLEAGGKTIEPASQDPYRSQLLGLRHGGIHEGRARAFGGTTKLWAGQALPLFDVDFDRRDWIPDSGWPVTRADILPYYRRAERVMQVPNVTYEIADWPKPLDPPSYDPDKIVSYFSQFTSEPDFSRKYGADLTDAPNIDVVIHANVTSIGVTNFATEATSLL